MAMISKYSTDSLDDYFEALEKL
jgi:hypothetical protein